MQYQKPPVVEVGIVFDFYPSAETPKWDQGPVERFFQNKKVNIAFPKAGAVYQQQVQVTSDLQNQTSSTTTFTPTICEFIARGVETHKLLSIAQNRMSYRLGRKGNEYPRYGLVSNLIFGMLPIYQSVWQPERIKNATLSYVDVIEFSEQEINLDEYFNLKFSFPDGLGVAGSMEGHIAFPEEKGYKDIVFRQVPSKKGNVVFQFFWTASRQIDTNNTTDVTVKQELDLLHSELIESFEASFTEKCKKLFNPSYE